MSIEKNSTNEHVFPSLTLSVFVASLLESDDDRHGVGVVFSLESRFETRLSKQTTTPLKNFSKIKNKV